uniref:BZIP domain-containing protein n=1 Tax=Steinernema glaseri TaxID=37863 RepID=A0A1I8AB67_9BILA
MPEMAEEASDDQASASTTAPVDLKVPCADLTIPASAVQKLEQGITSKSDVTGFPGVSLGHHSSEPKSPEKMKMALLTPAKDNQAVLKALSMETPKHVQEAKWRKRQEQSEKKFNERLAKIKKRKMNDDDTVQK